MNLVGDFVDKTIHNVDSEIIDILIEEFEKFKRKKTSMFMNKGGTLIKNFDTTNMMLRIIEIAAKINGLKNSKKFNLKELEHLYYRYDLLANAMLKSKYLNMKYAKDVEEMKEKFESLVVAAKLLD